ncbi:MAG: glucuronate isomerase [Balneola sp.]|jgi:glucuronate isomerase|nr:glucuronate isomerase [Balneola sp.]MBE77539.1 glucuronate isomerase [Balneola sp.]|tara:strand:+ start:119 stop:1537 length:1419 start_codon:yes stop_codon:yes gene_type:complete
MKKPFIHQDFLLQSEAAKKLYHNYSADQPIIDYHCHLPPQEIAENKNFENITKIWLDGDHYKWRAMRTCGVDEKFITGSASDKEKFLKWAETVPKTLKNPLYHWTHMELKNPFGITEQLLDGDSAEKIWDKCNEMLQSPEFSTRGLLKQNNVKVVATTDDPTDKLEFHTQLRDEGEDAFKMVPTFRPDRGMEIENGKEWLSWVEKLSDVTGVSISSFDDFLEALQQRHDFFDEMGCRASDHGTDRPYSDDFTDKEIASIFEKVLGGESPTEEETRKFKSAFLYHCGVMDAKKGWVYQLHVGAIRNNNSRMMKELGRDTGFDSIGDFDLAQPLAHLLNRLDSEDQLPKVILYNSNPRDNELMSTMIGNFQDGSVAGKLQHGPPWWFLDQKDGIEAHIESLSNMGVLSQLIGMTTDSRSFLSFPRHEYYRRVLCNVLGDDIEKGLLPSNFDLVGNMAKDISFKNANTFFGFKAT